MRQLKFLLLGVRWPGFFRDLAMGQITPRLLITAVAAVISMSLVPLLIRSTAANEITIGLVRLAIAVGLLSPFILLRSDLRKLTGSDWLGLSYIGIAFGFHWLTYFISIKMSSASIAALSISTYGIHLLLLNWLLKGQVIRLVEWAAVILCFVGVVLIAPSFNLRDQMTLGMLVGIFSGFLYASLPLLHQRILRVPTMNRAWGQFLFASLVFLPGLGYSNWDLSGGDWWRLLVLGVVCTVIGHSLWVKSSSELPPVITSVAYYLYVPLAMTGSFLFLGETITATMILGACFIITANISIAVLAWRRSNRLRQGAVLD
jgi:drug/metabolite transporter (DMT)-like permease